MEKTRHIAIGLLLVSAACLAQSPRTARELTTVLQEAQYQEQTAGNLDKAIDLYEQVLVEAAEVERLAARAAFQLAVCYRKKGDDAKAAEYFRKVVSKYPSQKALAERAAQELEAIAPDTMELTRHIIVQDSFEKGNDTPDGWQKGAFIDGVEYIWDKHVASDGKASLGFRKTAERYFPIAQWTRRIEYAGGAEQVELSAKVQAEQAYKAILDVLFLDEKDQWIKHQWIAYIGEDKEKNIPPANHSWKTYSGTADIPDNTKTIVIGLQMYGPGTVWFDEVEAALMSRREASPEEIVALVEKAVLTISTCAETDPRVKTSLDSLKGIQEEPVVAAISTYLGEESPTIRRAAIFILWRCEFSDISEAEQDLLELCVHPENFTRGMAAIALGGNRVSAAYDAIAHMTLYDEDGYARRCAAYALGLLGDPKALPTLEQALQDPEDLVKQNAEAAITMLTKLKTPEKEIKGLDAALSWLELVDKGQYAESWDTASGIMKKGLRNVGNFIAALENERESIGKFVSRQVRSTGYTQQLSGYPPGEYVIILFKAFYENKEEAIEEAVIMMLDSDGQWRVSGYKIQ